jgi:L-2-hydroxyglutarate oxidase LhgO
MTDLDVMVVGAGVVGLAVARACAIAGMRVAVIDRSVRFGDETSSRNSEVIHAGIYYPPGSLKARFCVEGRAALYGFCESRNIDYRRCGKLIVATSTQQHDDLKRLFRQACSNGVDDLVWLSPAEAQFLEPELQCTAALLSPSTGIIDSHALMNALVADLESAGATVALRTEFTGASCRDGIIEVSARIDATRFMLRSRWLVNSAGLHAVKVAHRIEGLDPQRIPSSYWVKGTYFSISQRPFSRLVYPLPNSAGLGVHATLDLAGRIRFGPDVEWISEIDYALCTQRAAAFYPVIRSFWPYLKDGALQPAYAGIRPKIAGPLEPAADFCISGPATHGVQGLINLFGIESPGLTAALPIGAHVARLIASQALGAREQIRI